MPAGRPTLYKPEFCDEIISLMATGLSLTACAGKLGVTRQSIYEWKATHPQFSYSVAVGEAKRQLWWELKGIENAETSNGNAGMIQFGMKNVGAQDWRDKIEIDQTVTQKPAEVDWTGVESEDVAIARDVLARATSPKPADKSKLNGQTKH